MYLQQNMGTFANAPHLIDVEQIICDQTETCVISTTNNLTNQYHFKSHLIPYIYSIWPEAFKYTA